MTVPAVGDSLTTTDQLAAMPPRSQVLAHWPDGSKPDTVVTRTASDHGVAKADTDILAGTGLWLELLTWGAELTAKHVAAAERTGCPDGGACHPYCRTGPCFRVQCSGPLSGVFPGNRWPEEIEREHQALDAASQARAAEDPTSAASSELADEPSALPTDRLATVKEALAEAERLWWSGEYAEDYADQPAPRAWQNGYVRGLLAGRAAAVDSAAPLSAPTQNTGSA